MTYLFQSTIACLLLLASLSLPAHSQSAEQQSAVSKPIRHTVAADGHPMAVWEKTPSGPMGTPSDPIGTDPIGTIVLIHGRTWSSLPDFDLQVAGEQLSLMDGLVAEGYRTFAIDLRGYGATPRDGTGWLTPDRAVRDVRTILDWIGSEVAAPPALFGWSNGALVAQLLAQRWPGLISDLILYGYPVDPARDWATPPSDPMQPPSDPMPPPREVNTAAAAASDFITPGTISQAAVDEYVRHALAADPVRVDWRALQQWSELDPAQISVPTLLIEGEFDPLAPDAAQARLFTQLGTADRVWVTLPGSDHAALLETARPRLIDAITGFLQRAEYSEPTANLSR